MDMLTDAAGAQLRLKDRVAFAGADHQGKPTINWGNVVELDVMFGKVCVYREGRSGIPGRDLQPRRVWVETAKVKIIEEVED
jgi:hypothetical protein